MRLPRPFVTTITDDDLVDIDDAGADDRIGRSAPQAASRMRHRPPHPPDVVYHDS
jgi:hypothetical protein